MSAQRAELKKALRSAEAIQKLVADNIESIKKALHLIESGVAEADQEGEAALSSDSSTDADDEKATSQLLQLIKRRRLEEVD